MRTKEGVLSKQLLVEIKDSDGHVRALLLKDAVLFVMDEYAKEIAIAFHEWRMNKIRMQLSDEAGQIPLIFSNHEPTEELFNQFIQSIKP